MNHSFDVIGDVHGHADALIVLLRKLGYEERQGAWRHSSRRAVFVGDFIDRGPSQIETITIGRRMVDAGSALAVMGNHEFNAIAWYLPNGRDFLRSHSGERGKRNRHQHAAFLGEVEANLQLHQELIDWFLSLPLWLDLPELQIIHACWHSRFMDYLAPMLKPGALLSEELMSAATLRPEVESELDSPEPSAYKAVEMLIKGMEIPLPQGFSFRDKDGISRTRVRTSWWDDEATTYRRAALLEDSLRKELPELPIPSHLHRVRRADKPLIIGHYWLTGTPQLLSKKVACVDYSAGKGGPLCAYRWDGESSLDASHFVSTAAGPLR